MNISLTHTPKHTLLSYWSAHKHTHTHTQRQWDLTHTDTQRQWDLSLSHTHTHTQRETHTETVGSLSHTHTHTETDRESGISNTHTQKHTERHTETVGSHTHRHREDSGKLSHTHTDSGITHTLVLVWSHVGAEGVLREKRCHITFTHSPHCSSIMPLILSHTHTHTHTHAILFSEHVCSQTATKCLSTNLILYSDFSVFCCVIN